MRRTPWAWSKVVKAAEELTSGQKLVWLELADLDQGPQRAFVSATLLAQRLGMGQDNVEQARRALRGYGLLGTGPAPGRKAPTWWPILPPDCEPSARPTDADVRTLAQRLDDIVRDTRADRGVSQYASPPPTGGVPQYANKEGSEGVSQYASSEAAGGVLHYAGRGVGGRAPNSNELGTSSPNSLDMKRSQGVERVRTRTKEKGEPLARDAPPSQTKAVLEKHLGPRPRNR